MQNDFELNDPCPWCKHTHGFTSTTHAGDPCVRCSNCGGTHHIIRQYGKSQALSDPTFAEAIQIHMPPASDGADVIKAILRYRATNPIVEPAPTLRNRFWSAVSRFAAKRIKQGAAA